MSTVNSGRHVLEIGMIFFSKKKKKLHGKVKKLMSNKSAC